MSKVFEKTNISKIVLNNHIIRSATGENMADENGVPTEALIKTYEALARGGVGCIITGYIGINNQGRADSRNMTLIDENYDLKVFKNMTDRIHSLNTPIIAQLVHCGGQINDSNRDIIVPSKIKDYKGREITKAEIEEVINDFVKSIVRSKEVGFDGVQIHMAHGYLISEFLSPRMNKRKDEWGNNTENRCKISVEIIKRARQIVDDFPIIAKINGYETLKYGMTIEESIKISKILEEAGYDAIEVSNGTMKAGLATLRGNVPSEMVVHMNPKLNNLPNFIKNGIINVGKKVISKPAPIKVFNLEAAKRIKENIDIPVIVVGGFNDLDEIEHSIDNNIIDFVSMARPFIIEPNIVSKMKSGKQRKSKCIQCNYCLIGAEYEGLRCYYGKLPNIK